jgi:ABC-2 type transport system permease protein
VISLVRAEIYKLRTTPSVWALPLVTMILTALFGVIRAFVINSHNGTGAQFQAPVTVPQLRNLTGAGYVAGTIIAPVLGVLMVTTEFRHKGITGTLLITPRRERVLLAKAIATVIWAVILWMCSLALIAAMGIPLLVSEGGSLSAMSHQVTPVIFGVLGTYILLSLFGLGLGILIKNQISGVLVAVVWTLVLEQLLVALASALWHVDLNWLPSQAGLAVSGGLHEFMDRDNMPLLSVPLGVCSLLLWGLVPAIVGYFTTFRRDVT